MALNTSALVVPDYEFLQLEEVPVQQLLAEDNLCVFCEENVVEASACWISFDEDGCLTVRRLPTTWTVTEAHPRLTFRHTIVSVEGKKWGKEDRNIDIRSSHKRGGLASELPLRQSIGLFQSPFYGYSEWLAMNRGRSCICDFAIINNSFSFNLTNIFSWVR